MPLRRTVPLLLLVLGLACFLRFAGQSERSFIPEEALVLRQAVPAVHGTFAAAHPPRRALVPAAVARFFLKAGMTVPGLRMTSAVPSVLACVAMAVLAARSISPLVGVFSAALWAVAPVSIEAGRVLGAESWAALFVLTAAVFFADALRRGSVAAWLGNGAALLVAAFLTPLAIALAFGQFVTAVMLRSSRAILASAVLGVAVSTAVVLSPVPLQPPVVATQWDWPAFLSLGSVVPWAAVPVIVLALWGVRVWLREAPALLRPVLPVLALASAVGAALDLVWAAEFVDVDRTVLSALGCFAGGIGLAALCRSASWFSRAAGLGALVTLAVAFVPACRALLAHPPPDWAATAALVRDNALPGEKIVVPLHRDLFLLHAPQLARRVDGEMPPGRGLGFFGGAQRGWFVLPAEVRFYPAWPRIERWVDQFRVTDLSPDPRLLVYYFSRGGGSEALARVATFSLPASTLARGSLLRDLVRDEGPGASVLWKVDQLALWRTPRFDRNPALLEAVRLLDERGFGDRGASLAYALARADPQWPEARALRDLIRRAGEPR